MAKVNKSVEERKKKSEEQEEFDHLDYHIRSATTLAHILWYSGDCPTKTGQNLSIEPDFVIVILNNLAQCLVRSTLETVAIGLLSRSSVIAGNTSPMGPSGPTHIERVENTKDDKEGEEFRHGLYARNSPRADFKLSDNANVSPEALSNKLDKSKNLPSARSKKSRASKDSSDVASYISNEAPLPPNNESDTNWDVFSREIENGKSPSGTEIARIVYEYRSFMLKNCSRDKANDRIRNPYPDFRSHATMVFLLLKRYLEAKEPSTFERTRNNFELYVMGMSLAKLEEKVKEPKWKGREASSRKMHDFLLKENITTLDFQDNEKKFNLTRCDTDYLFWLANEENMQWTSQKKENIREGVFNSEVALAFHQMVKTYFQRIMTYLQKLTGMIPPSMDQRKQEQVISNESQEFQEPFGELWGSLTSLSWCVHYAGDLMDLYVKAIKISPSPLLTPTRRAEPSTETSLTDEQEVSEDTYNDKDDVHCPNWRIAYETWIKGVVRQTRAAAILTSLDKSQYKDQISIVNFDILDEAPPSSAMEPWNDTIAGIYKDATGDEQRIGEEVERYLKILASNNSSDKDADYRPLQKENAPWEKSFKGTFHCEAMIVTRNLK